MKKIKIWVIALILAMMAFTPAVNADLAANAKVTGFTDTQSHWGKDTIIWGQGLGIALGFPDGSFRPDSTVTEAQFLAMLERTFTNTSDGTPWYQPYYDLAGQYNYPVGNKPDAVILRTQVAEIVAGTQGKNYTGDNAIQYLLGKGLAKGYDANIVSIPNYHGGDTLTRAQAVQFIRNLKDAGIEEIKERPFDPSPVSELPELPVTEEQPSTSYSRTIALEGDPMFTNVTLNPENIGTNNDVFSVESINKTGDIKGIVRYYWVCTSHPGMNTYHTFRYPDKVPVTYTTNDELTSNYFIIGTLGAYDTALEKGMVLTYDIYDINHVLVRTVDIQL